MKVIKSDKYLMGVSGALTENDIGGLTQVFDKESVALNNGLEGRGSVSFFRSGDGTRAVVRQYRRGGLVRYISSSAYIKSGKYRCEAEFDILLKLREIGVRVPEPLVWAVRGHRIYRCWLVTREIPDAYTLSTIRDEEQLCQAIQETIQQIQLLVKNRILHVDLHPGNVLVNQDGAYLIDFDKAGHTEKTAESLTDFYRERWVRAVRKHNLPDILADAFIEHL